MQIFKELATWCLVALVVLYPSTTNSESPIPVPSRETLERAFKLSPGSIESDSKEAVFAPQDLKTGKFHSCPGAQRYKIKGDTEVMISVGRCHESAFDQNSLRDYSNKIELDLSKRMTDPAAFKIPVPFTSFVTKSGRMADIGTLPVVGHGLFFAPTVVLHSLKGPDHLVLQLIIDDGATKYPVSYFTSQMLKDAAETLDHDYQM